MQKLPRVLIVSVPKGGTNLLTQVILGIPGMVQTRRNMLAPIHRQTGTMIQPGEMGVMHLPFSEDAARILADQQIRIIFISRDLRDVAVSMMHFIASSFPSHVLYPAFQTVLTNNTERLSAIIRGVTYQMELTDTVIANELYVAQGTGIYPDIGCFWAPYQGWLKSGIVHQVSYEDLAIEGPRRTAAIDRIVGYLWEDLRSLGIPKGLLVAQMEQNINPALSPTFRAGRIGDWKTEFSADHVRDFKQRAGQTLIDLGYENGMGW